MAIKKIGSANVNNGSARGWFTIPESLPKGVYQLIGKYSGTNIYKPSYDIKKLIIGYYSEFTGIRDKYLVNELSRKLAITGRLVGYDADNEVVPLKNQKIGLKIGSTSNPNGYSDAELSFDATALMNTDGSYTVRTDNNGYFTFETTIPESFTNWDYNVYIGYGGNNDYVNTVRKVPIYIGKCPTYVYITAKPGLHIYSKGSVVLNARVFKQNEVSNGQIPDYTHAVKSGNLIFKEANNTSMSGQTVCYDTNNGTKMEEQSLRNDGTVQLRIEYDADEDDIIHRYYIAKYSGSDADDYGYQSGTSEILHVQIDQNGVKAEKLTTSLNCATDEAIFMVEGESKTCTFYANYGSTSKPVPTGYLDISIKDKE